MHTMLKLSSLLAALALAPLALAEVPVFRDQVLAIDEAVVINAAGTAAFYADVRLKANADGSFSVAGGDRRPLALIDSVDIVINKSNPVQVEAFVAGKQTVACVGLEEPVVTRKDNAFTVVLAETLMPPGTVCMSLLAVTEFQRDIELPVAGLPAGTYTVNVNGKQVSFTL